MEEHIFIAILVEKYRGNKLLGPVFEIFYILAPRPQKVNSSCNFKFEKLVFLCFLQENMVFS